MRRSPGRAPRCLAAAAAAAVLAAGCSPSSGAPAGPVSDVLAELEVRPAQSSAGYDRDLFGDGWVDVDGDGCRTREQVLRRDLDDVEVRPGTGGCVVETGVPEGPYTGVVVDVRRGERTSEEVQVDHVVALAADGDANQDKGSGDAAVWLPPERAARCPYAARQVAVKGAYGLWVTEREHDALVDVLAGCPDEPLPAG